MNRFVCFVVGALAGALGGVLLAPQSGKETRGIVAEQATNVANSAQEVGTRAVSNIQDGIKQASEKGAQVVNTVKDAASKGVAAASDRNDELRQKIEAARERIAAQVKSNAETSAKAIKDEIPAAGEEAANAVDAAAKAVEDAADQAAGTGSTGSIDNSGYKPAK